MTGKVGHKQDKKTSFIHSKFQILFYTFLSHLNIFIWNYLKIVYRLDEEFEIFL